MTGTDSAQAQADSRLPHPASCKEHTDGLGTSMWTWPSELVHGSGRGESFTQGTKILRHGTDLQCSLALEKEQSLPLTEYLLHARHCTRHFGHILILNPDTTQVVGGTTFPILERIEMKLS